jgi:hypothetical protein
MMAQILFSLTALLFFASCSSTPKANEMGLLRPQVRAVVDSHMNDFNGCYKRSLKTNPKLSGTVTMDFEVGDSGKIVRLNTNTTGTSLRDRNVQNCVSKVMKSLSYPSAPSGTVLVTSYPFLFVPGL